MNNARENGACKNVGKREVTLTVNGEPESVLVYSMERLLDVLRNELRLTGTK